MNYSNLASYFYKTYGISVKGVFHVGAHYGEEAEDYNSLGWPVIWVEGDPDIFKTLKERVNAYPNQFAYECLCSDVSNTPVLFHRTSNDGHSSSILVLSKEMHSVWGIKPASQVMLKTRRLDDMIVSENIILSPYNFLNIDIQGCELQALIGLGTLLSRFEVLLIELDWGGCYEGVSRPREIESFLSAHGFQRIFLSIGYPQGYGIWILRESSYVRLAYQQLSMALFQFLADFGFVRVFQKSIFRKWLRDFYYYCSGRNY